MSGLVRIDASMLGRFGRQLRRADADTKAIVTAGLMSVAQAAAAEAKEKAGWSTTIPATIRAGGAGTQVYVRAGGTRAPHAAPYEHRGEEGTFRHPVFGDRSVWVRQAARPFLTRPVTAHAEAGGEQIADAIVRAIERMP